MTAEAQDGVGAPDALQRLWTPHRMAYIKREGESGPEGGAAQCPFCRISTMADAEGLVIARAATVYAVLNLYPYNPGHLMVVPYRHVADYPDLTVQEATELATFTQRAMLACRRAAAPHGFNIGINQGAVGGAGIAAHLHQHVVPRWGGDANFMPVVAGTKVLPQLLAETHKLLVNAWNELP
ncbi:MAG: HIT family hydrolase [Pseudonocardiales bacterium]|nr:MAG: HIT family hydrolase [Pseudonocardiales bacterium]